MDYFQSKKPIRVCISFTRSSPYWDAPESSLEHILQKLSCDPDSNKRARLLVKQKWPRHLFLIYDFFHINYDHATAHRPEENNIPVLKVDSREDITFRIAEPPFRARVNGDVARIHNLNGFTEPPYFDDHSGAAPVYYNPRDGALLSLS